MPLITAAQLKQILPGLKDDRAAFVADLHSRICPTYGINSADILQEFLANEIVESWSFAMREESLNYSAEALLKTWPKHFTPEQAKEYARQPEKIANYIYGPESSIGKMLGNTGATDGWDLRGGGWMQMTGRSAYEPYQKHKGFTTVAECAAAVRGSDWYALDSACYIYANEKGLVKASIGDNLLYTVRKINGGTNGLEEREKYYDRAKIALV